MIEDQELDDHSEVVEEEEVAETETVTEEVAMTEEIAKIDQEVDPSEIVGVTEATEEMEVVKGKNFFILCFHVFDACLITKLLAELLTKKYLLSSILGLDRVEYKKNNDLIIEEMTIMEVEKEEEAVVIEIAEVGAEEIEEEVVTVVVAEIAEVAEIEVTEEVVEVEEKIDSQKIKLKQQCSLIKNLPNSNKRMETLHPSLF